MFAASVFQHLCNCASTIANCASTMANQCAEALDEFLSRNALFRLRQVGDGDLDGDYFVAIGYIITDSDEESDEEDFDFDNEEQREFGAMILNKTSDAVTITQNQVDAEMECAVCLGEYEVGEDVRRFYECGHHFHADCIIPWLAREDHCPTCRTKIQPNNPLLKNPYFLASHMNFIFLHVTE